MIQNIQVLRFVAAFWVALYHVRPTDAEAGSLPQLYQLTTSILNAGGFGVDMFFVISGVIMAETTRALRPGPGQSFRFAALRFARIYAGWWPFFFLYLFYQGHWPGGKSLWGSIFLPSLPLHEYLVPFVWTLSFELYFYTVIAALLWMPRAWQVAAVAAWGGVIGVAYAWNSTHGLYLPGNAAQATIAQTYLVSPLVVEFIAGFLLCEWLRKTPPLPGRGWVWLCASGAFGVLAIAYQHYGQLEPGGLLNSFSHSFERAILLGGTACCLAMYALATRPLDGPATGWMARLGNASYSIYLGHSLVFAVIHETLARSGLGNAPAGIRYSLLLGSLLVYSWLHFHWIEEPLHRISRRWIEKVFAALGVTPRRPKGPALGLIYARSRNGVIGHENRLPWRLPEDLAHFKATTLGCPVIMGRKTWDSLPAKFRPLPDRRNIVITRQPRWQATGAKRAGSLKHALSLCEGAARAWVAGGAEIYALALPLADTVVVTEIDADFEGDAYAPKLGPQWRETAREAHRSNGGVPFAFVTYRREAAG